MFINTQAIPNLRPPPPKLNPPPPPPPMQYIDILNKYRYFKNVEKKNVYDGNYEFK